MGLVSKPYTFSPNTTAKSSEVNDDFDTIYNAFNGNISGANLADGAVTTAKIVDSAVTSAKILDGTIVAADLDADLAKGWTTGLGAPDTVTYNGNRSYNIVYNSADKTGTVSNGMRLRLTRTVTAPTQCTSLNGTTQYYNKTSPAAMTFTDDFVVSAWIKLTSYAAATIASRWNGTSGWTFDVNSSGQLQLVGFNAGAGNNSYVLSYQSVPLNKWVHVTAQLDMSSFTATTTTSYVMIDGLDVPASVTRSGTNPTALVQAGNLEIGSRNGGTQFFPGKLAQVAIFNAKVTQATIRTYISQGLAGTETSLISAYSFNNSINDLSSNANNLTAQGSAVATNADSQFGLQADGTTAGTTEYAIITKTAFSTNTTITVQVPEGNAIPTSGGVSAVAYSTQKVPYGMPTQKNKWRIQSFLYGSQVSVSGAAVNTWYNPGNIQLNVPIGNWDVGYSVPAQANGSTGTAVDLWTSLGNSVAAPTNPAFTAFCESGASATVNGSQARNSDYQDISASTTYYGLIKVSLGAGTVSFLGYRGEQSVETLIYADLATL